MSKLIIIRGNSGAGKSTLAHELRERLKGKRVAIVGQDHLRRIILKEKDKPDKKDILGLLKLTVQYCLNLGYITILEGILNKEKYQDLIKELIAEDSTESYVFYLDVSFEETLRRHQTKSKANEFGEREMRQWYQEKNVLGVEGEIILNEKLSLEEMLDEILPKIEA